MWSRFLAIFSDLKRWYDLVPRETSWWYGSYPREMYRWYGLVPREMLVQFDFDTSRDVEMVWFQFPREMLVQFDFALERRKNALRLSRWHNGSRGIPDVSRGQKSLERRQKPWPGYIRKHPKRIYALFGVKFEVLKIALAYKKLQITGILIKAGDKISDSLNKTIRWYLCWNKVWDTIRKT